MDKLGKCVCCAYQKRRNVTKVGRPTEKRTFRCPRGRRIFLHKSLHSSGTKVKNWFAMLSQIREKLNTPTDNEQLFRQSTSSWFGSVNHYPWEFKHPAKNANELGPAWQNLAGKSHIHGHKENGLELFKFRRNFGEIKQPITLNQPQWRTLHF